MESYIFKTVIFVSLIIYGLIRMPFMKKCKLKQNIKSENLSYEKFKVFIAWLGMVLVPIIFVFSNVFIKFDMNLPVYIRILGVMGLIADAIFFYYIHKELSDNWSPVLEIKAEQKLIKTGVYKYIRHPMYTQCWLWVFFTGIVASNWFVLVFGLVTWGFLYFTRVFNEEKMMLGEFGTEYSDYMKQTGRIFPKIF